MYMESKPVKSCIEIMCMHYSNYHLDAFVYSRKTTKGKELTVKAVPDIFGKTV